MRSSGILLDTGPLVAYLYRGDAHHRWAVEIFDAQLPFITCEPVLTEACFVAARNRVPPERVLETMARGVIQIGLRLDEELPAIRALMRRYANVPMSLADACLVRLAEMTGLPICTLDRDFAIYRTSRRRALNLIMPNDPRSLHEP
jgi:predicted nucleic acid-binding protein